MNNSSSLIVLSPGEGKQIRSTGHSDHGLATGAETAGAYAAQSAQVAPRNRNRPHYHTREAECLIILQGGIDVLYDGDWHEATAGAVVHMPAGVSHAIRNHGQVPARLVSLFVPAGLEAMFQELMAGETDWVAAAARYGVTLLESDAPPEDQPGASHGQTLQIKQHQPAEAQATESSKITLLAREDTGGDYALSVIEMPPGVSASGLQTLEHALAGVVYQGTLALQLDSADETQKLSLTAGAFMHLPEGTSHALTNTGEQTALVFVWE